MGKYIPVDPEKGAAMVKAQSDLVRYKEICDDLDAECSRLKSEVEELTGLLKASTYYNTSDEVTRLKAEVERLTKAGDAMVKYVWNLNNDFQNTGDYEGFFSEPASEIERIWNAAKEGKQP